MSGRSGHLAWVGGSLMVLAACAGQPAPRGPSSAPPASPEWRPVAEPAPAQNKDYSEPTEAEPEYWLAKLSDAEWRSRAIKRLEQLFEDAFTRANADLTAAEVQRLVSLTVGPLTRTYVEHYAALDVRTRVTLIKLLAEYRDRRSAPAFRKAFEAFARQPVTSKDESDIRWAARGTAALKLEPLAAPMLEAYLKLRASTMLGGVTYRDFNQAMVAMPHKSWVEPLIHQLGVEIKPPLTDKALIDPFRDQMFWQTTAAQLLGLIGDLRAIEPLVKVMLDPAKADIQATALHALVRLGKPAVRVAAELLEGKRAELVAFNVARSVAFTGKTPQGAPHREAAALVLGASGHADAAPALIAAADGEKDPALRAFMARELTRLPPSDATKAAFKRAYAATTLGTTLPPGSSALEQLTEAAGRFRASALVDWLLARAARAQGSPDDVKRYRAVVVMVALNLARPGQLPAVKKTIDRFGAELEKRAYRQVEELLESCGEQLECYLTAIHEPQNQEHDRRFIGIKAAYMLGVLGDAQARDQLIAVLDGVTSAAVRFEAAQTIDYLTPNGSHTVVGKLDAIIARNAESQDLDKIAADAPLRMVVSRIGARD